MAKEGALDRSKCFTATLMAMVLAFCVSIFGRHEQRRGVTALGLIHGSLAKQPTIFSTFHHEFCFCYFSLSQRFRINEPRFVPNIAWDACGVILIIVCRSLSCGFEPATTRATCWKNQVSPLGLSHSDLLLAK